MPALEMKPEYGPTLGRLLEPRWRAASRVARAVVVAAGAALALAIVAAVLTLENASYSQGGSVPFSFKYRGLYRVAPDQGGYVRVALRHSDGRLRDSFAVDPLRLAPYAVGLSAELPLYAASYIRELRGRYPGFVLRGEGKTKVNTVPAYAVFYTALLEGQKLYGRDILLLPERRGAREGVDIVLLTSASESSKSATPAEVGTTGILQRPLRSFTFG
jgi:hypothetical protein